MGPAGSGGRATITLFLLGDAPFSLRDGAIFLFLRRLSESRLVIIAAVLRFGKTTKMNAMKKLVCLLLVLAVNGCAIGSNCSLGQREPCKFIPFIAPPGTTVVPAAGPR